MPKFAIKTPEGKYLKMPPADVEVNREVLRIGAQITSAPYNYKTAEAVAEAFSMINQYISRNNPTADQRKATPSEWRYHKYIDRQIGCFIVQI